MRSVIYKGKGCRSVRTSLLHCLIHPAKEGCLDFAVYDGQVTIQKPLGFTLARGNDAGAYVQRTDPNAGNTDERIQVQRTS